MRGRDRAIIALFDDDIDDYSVGDWRGRNLKLVDVLVDLGLFDLGLVSREAHHMLTDSLIHVLNGAATDPQNAGHVRAQNENVLHYGLALGAPARTLTLALEAGFIHDLNKAFGEPLRQDEFGVRDGQGKILTAMTTMAQIVGLNHLGERTRSALAAATRLGEGAMSPETARAIDLCVVHHGLGSSRFIQDLVAGKNPWWGAEFVEPETRARKLVHPPEPPLTLESVIHDLADSTQQMQGGAAWVMKYPAGFWRASSRSLADMLGGRDVASSEGAIPLSLRLQIDAETATCHEIVRAAERDRILDEASAARLKSAVVEAVRSSLSWIDDSPEYLRDPDGVSVYHDVARKLGISAEESVARLREAISGSPESDRLEDLVWESGRRVDLDRARQLAMRILAQGGASLPQV